MQSWEYLTLTVREGIVMSAGGYNLAKESIWGGAKGQPLPDFLNKLGKLGWEAVGVSTTTVGGANPLVQVELIVILKRPLS